VSDRELLERILTRLGSVDQKLKVTQSKAGPEENLVSAWRDVAGLEIMIRDHLRNADSHAKE
jgi:hypothetical protein